MTPIQTAINEIEAHMEIADNHYTKRGLRIARDTLIKYKSVEKEWAEKVWEGGAKYKADNESTGTGCQAPDFNTYYSQYNQEK